MVDALIKIVDRLISLVQSRNQGRRSMFESVLEPVFNDLLVIHGDYIKMFEDVKMRLPGPDEESKAYVRRLEDDMKQLRKMRLPGPDEESKAYRKRLEDAKKQLRKRRLEFEPVRSKVRALAYSLSKKKFPPEEQRFIGKILTYFPTADQRDLWPTTTPAENLLDHLDRVEYGSQIDYVLRETIQRHKNSWSDVCEAFAALKVKIAQLR